MKCVGFIACSDDAMPNTNTSYRMFHVSGRNLKMSCIGKVMLFLKHGSVWIQAAQSRVINQCEVSERLISSIATTGVNRTSMTGRIRGSLYSFSSVLSEAWSLQHTNTLMSLSCSLKRQHTHRGFFFISLISRI